jgi:hypothetical protein
VIAADPKLTAYATVDGQVHGVMWKDYKGLAREPQLVLICTRRGVTATRTAANPEAITCLICLASAIE